MKKLTNKQSDIIAHVRAFGMITKKKADEMLKHYYHSNHSKYVQQILRSLIVTHKLLERQQRGVYIMRKKFLSDDPSQIALFDPYKELNGRVPEGEEKSDFTDK